MSPQARVTDDDEHYEDFTRRRRYERARTVFLSMVCAGITTLAIVYPIEVKNNKNDRSNCVVINSIPRLLADQNNGSANRVLGKGRPDQPGYVRPFDFNGTTLEDFKPLIIAQARQSRVRAAQFAQTVRDCNKAFPQPQFFGLDVVPGD